jgi:hypothetical protein
MRPLSRYICLQAILNRRAQYATQKFSPRQDRAHVVGEMKTRITLFKVGYGLKPARNGLRVTGRVGPTELKI